MSNNKVDSDFTTIDEDIISKNKEEIRDIIVKSIDDEKNERLNKFSEEVNKKLVKIRGGSRTKTAIFFVEDRIVYHDGKSHLKPSNYEHLDPGKYIRFVMNKDNNISKSDILEKLKDKFHEIMFDDDEVRFIIKL
jgi:hypothetical protein